MGRFFKEILHSSRSAGPGVVHFQVPPNITGRIGISHFLRILTLQKKVFLSQSFCQGSAKIEDDVICKPFKVFRNANQARGRSGCGRFSQDSNNLGFRQLINDETQTEFCLSFHGTGRWCCWIVFNSRGISPCLRELQNIFAPPQPLTLDQRGAWIALPNPPPCHPKLGSCSVHA